MRSWLALIVAPSLMLGVQSVMYALVTPSCAAQARFGLHASGAIALAVTVLLAVLAWGEWKRLAEPASADHDAGDPRTARRFLAIMGTAVAALSSLVILAMWFGTWVLSPCSPWP